MMAQSTSSCTSENQSYFAMETHRLKRTIYCSKSHPLEGVNDVTLRQHTSFLLYAQYSLLSMANVIESFEIHYLAYQDIIRVF